MIRFRRNQPAPPPARMVRLHTVSPDGKADLTFEGLLARTTDDGHYVLVRPRVLDGTEAVDEPPRGTEYEIPIARVWFREILAEDAAL